MQLEGKITLITGGSSGIGRETAKLFAQEGARVALADIDVASGKAVLDEIHNAGGIAVFDRVDVSIERDVRDWIATVVRTWGGVDILVANAAAMILGTIEQTSEEDWDRVFGVNVKGYAFCAKYAAPYMRQRGGGAIVNLASIGSVVAISGFTPYCASKGAILQLTRCLAQDLAPDNIRVNCVCPGVIDTPAVERVAASVGLSVTDLIEPFILKTPISRMGKPREVAEAILFLSSDRSSFITGSSLMVDGGYTAL
jgi:NAD(P)-dependent dehydrogenase (short-subunit alcohol dehydrogenase family)